MDAKQADDRFIHRDQSIIPQITINKEDEHVPLLWRDLAFPTLTEGSN